MLPASCSISGTATPIHRRSPVSLNLLKFSEKSNLPFAKNLEQVRLVRLVRFVGLVRLDLNPNPVRHAEEEQHALGV